MFLEDLENSGIGLLQYERKEKELMNQGTVKRDFKYRYYLQNKNIKGSYYCTA